MEPNIVGYIPRLLYKLYLKLKEKFDMNPPTPEDVLFAIEICEKVLQHPDSKLTLAPISGKRFIKNEVLDMFIVIEGRAVNIINHTYSYTIYVEENDKYLHLVRSFDSTLETHRKVLEDEIKENIKFSLKRILNELN
jgi:hypothetical protein